MISTISAKGRIVIPSELRRKYPLTPGTKVVIVDNHGALTIISTTEDPIEKGEANDAEILGKKKNMSDNPTTTSPIFPLLEGTWAGKGRGSE